MNDREAPLSISWHDTAWIPVLNPGNVMDYFSDRSNPFYDRTCNNEVVKMQRLGLEQLNNMSGLEYILLHVQEPILYVVRKQHRHSSTQVTPLADYYIIAGIVYQAPDLCSVINSRLLNTTHYLQSAFEEALSFSRYHPSKGYWWEFKEKQQDTKNKKKEKKKDEQGSIFQIQRVDALLEDLSKRFPPKSIQPPPPPPPEKPIDQENKSSEEKVDVKLEKEEDETPTQSAAQRRPAPTDGIKPPPDKKPKLLR
ncbi:PREDICTED: mediator of RNA polymerase II transcription subunit 6-like isoform X2 [Priapulus caudatus]|uniref:Mediator of RNA polymerase II transcription subunit 6 n=1 Tax=Priapulus caudatus TaxID=37621 RepID=A0ABM1EHX8_PRICU|nr:PREDICTED: mediator of RNA polymerase II transcription subunit 6-like isoform X2 [Priapulus caudatus]